MGNYIEGGFYQNWNKCAVTLLFEAVRYIDFPDSEFGWYPREVVKIVCQLLGINMNVIDQRDEIICSHYDRNNDNNKTLNFYATDAHMSIISKHAALSISKTASGFRVQRNGGVKRLIG